ncbi:glycosyltransferase [Candidatus Nitrosopelagicus sp.]|nr:glycosyltransferase [Candidatus Nitrosopelagicus sp.]
MSIRVLAIGDLANNFVILRKYVKESDIHIINFPWDTASKLTESRDVEFFDSLKIKEQIEKINSIKDDFDLAIVNTWAGARLAYLTGMNYIIYFVGSALRVPPFIKNPRLDYLKKPLPTLNGSERKFYRKVFDNALSCVAAGSDLFKILKEYKNKSIHQIDIPVDTEMFNDQIKPLEKKKTKFTFLSPQRIGLAKGIDIIWDAIKLTKTDFEVLQVKWFLGQRTDEEKEINENLVNNSPEKVKYIPVFKREDIPKAFCFADAIIGQMRSGLGGAVEREGAFCKKPVLQYANPEIKFLVDSSEINSPFLPQSNDPLVLAKLIDKIVLSKEFRDELVLDEYNFVKEIADPVKIAGEWDKLFTFYLSDKNNQNKISSYEIKLRQTNFFFINKLYFNKIKKKIRG